MPPGAPAGTITLEAALDRLAAGEVVAFPTETVWGLGADATNPDAVERVYELKGRPRDKPMPVLVADLGMARSLTPGLTGRALRLAQAFWPGPLTIVLPATPAIPPIVTADGGTVAVRAPGHSGLLDLVRRLGRPVIAPSANRAGQPPATTLGDTLAAFPEQIATGALACYVPEAPFRAGATPSTIVIPGDTPGADVVVRQGPVTALQLAQIA
ncbi:MAG: threonylcarbamoyl-AMP synthase [Phycisphaeraceae bacterium]|nr:threonylcarbamoyl-AMP synthase [Phycisphaeraceae bacterium]MCB9847917.1 threonylcarbamoyl-AMP synthase [Phycisphaeraceae bacterium]